MKAPNGTQPVSYVLAYVLGVVAALLLTACSGDGRSYTPTEPFVPTSPPPPSSPLPATWSGSWTFDQATPTGDCLANALNAFRNGLSAWQINLAFEQDAGRAHLRFFFGPGNDDNEGFWPLEFTGTVSADGAVLATVPAANLGFRRSDPWGELCYWEWTMQGGQLTATLSPDGRRLTGTIVESFRAETTQQVTTFTIHSHFTAVAP